MAGTRGKVAAESFAYSVTETITVEVKMTRSFVPMGDTLTKYLWGWTILVEGRVRFSGADLMTAHNEPTIAARTVMFYYCPRDGRVPYWFQGEANASQKNWFKITGPRMAPVVERIESIGMYPGAQVITKNGLVPFSKDGVPVDTIVSGTYELNDQEVEEVLAEGAAALRRAGVVVDSSAEELRDVLMGSVSEDTRRGIDARDNFNRDSGNVAAATRPLVTSPFNNE